MDVEMFSDPPLPYNFSGVPQRVFCFSKCQVLLLGIAFSPYRVHIDLLGKTGIVKDTGKEKSDEKPQRTGSNFKQLSNRKGKYSINCMTKLVQIQTDIIFLSKCKQMDIVPKGLKTFLLNPGFVLEMAHLDYHTHCKESDHFTEAITNRRAGSSQLPYQDIDKTLYALIISSAANPKCLTAMNGKMMMSPQEQEEREIGP
ncbi:hypothetical protein UY3_01917 [Chelonia mydas]|uniref:Uncharacterized protein n=1 Tax=Chelonia mydas TaxID=8469 RepID=M7BSD3_CHEMY|nr:hypothetical protein UY3_01917 [Chelonia mydas]